MILRRRRIYPASPGSLYRIHSETSGKQLFGFSFGSSFVKLGDQEGSQWSGMVLDDGNGGQMLRFRDGAGQTMTGSSDGQTLMLRDSRGRTWKGFVD